MEEGQLFDPDRPPEAKAFDRTKENARLERIKAQVRSKPGWYRHHDAAQTRIMDQFHDRRSE